MGTTERIQFTDGEREQLAVSVREGAASIAELWDTLKKVENRLGLDWEPSCTSVAGILELFAVNIGDPLDVDQSVRPGDVVAAFSLREHWKKRSRV